MTYKFLIAVEMIMRIEGGLVDHPDDPGGITKYGISLRAHKHLGRDGIKNLTKQEAREIYYEDYWKPIEAEKMPPRIALCAFDAAVNHGPGVATKLLQECLRVKIDGIIGPKTLTAIHTRQEDYLLNSYLSARHRRYLKLEHYATFGEGWLNRLFTVCRDAEKIEIATK